MMSHIFSVAANQGSRKLRSMNHWKQYIIKISILKSSSLEIYIQQRFIHTATVFILFSPKYKLPPGGPGAEAHTKSHLVLLHSCLKSFIFHKLQK